MSSEQVPGAEQPTEAELMAAYEAQLNRIPAAEMAMQAAVSLLNLGGRRLGLLAAPDDAQAPERDLEQVRDAIDAVRGLMPVLERRFQSELRALRDALSQLQIAYARELRGGGATAEASAGTADGPQGAPASSAKQQQPGADATQQPGASAPQQPGQRPSEESTPGAGKRGPDQGSDPERRPGPAEASGRLWVPGR
jgi:hypothetical protein